MSAVVQCVPNFSEGRDAARLGQIVRAILEGGDVALLGSEMDADHHRAVVTFAGPPRAVVEAAFRAIAKARDLIDLNAHKGEHPRMGATDVCPLVPVRGITRPECVELARALARRVGEELGIPVFLYEDAALRPDRRNLADIRKGEFEGLRERLGSESAVEPDFGPHRIHPTAGATAIGVRGPLIAFNVNLKTDDLPLAKRIASGIREKGGGLPAVKAAGFRIAQRNLAQVSMNLVDYERTSPGRAYRAVEEKAREAGAQILESEVVGLIPREALVRSAIDLLSPRDFRDGQILERQLESQGLGGGSDDPQPAWGVGRFLAAVASPAPTPGGGSASALAGALGAALGEMVCRLAEAKGAAEPLGSSASDLASLRARLQTLVDRDAAAYEGYVRAMRLPKGSPEEKAQRRHAIDVALRQAIDVPLDVMDAGQGVLRALVEVARHGPVHAVSDAAVGALLARTSVRGAARNVRINLKGKEDLFREAAERCADMERESDRLAGEIEKISTERLAGGGEGGT
ncbi:MAG: glutamate formimidoyltransferase [Planctomycetes bacterium]|nr:glutamate formimidoyltransferase [Planctomycetota bacterium]